MAARIDPCCGNRLASTVVGQPMQTLRPNVVSSILALAALVVVACSGVPALPGSSSATGALVTVETRGGECLNGPCGSTTAIERDGRVHSLAPAEADLGQVPPEVLTALDAAIKTTDFADLKSHPFTGECPVNFDGQEVIYEFGAPSGTERIASCEVEVDPGLPLFAAVQAALAAVGAA
jgi:hypothetical protein